MKERKVAHFEMKAKKFVEAKWTWDDQPVRPMRGASLQPSWWSNSGAKALYSAETAAHRLYLDESELQEEERAAVHNCCTQYHLRRVYIAASHAPSDGRLGKSDKQQAGGGILTPLFHGRTPATSFVMQKYIASLIDQEDETRRTELTKMAKGRRRTPA